MWLSAVAKNKTKIVFYGKYLLFDGQFVAFLRKRWKVYLKYVAAWSIQWPQMFVWGWGVRRVRPKFWFLTEVLSWI